jgi:citrate lyase beta subunit
MLSTSADANLPPNSLELSASIESALGVVNLVEISRAGFKRPLRFSFGMGDFTTDMGVEWSRDETESATPRSIVSIVSRAAGLLRPRDSAFVNLNDMDGLRESARRGKRLGYGGKSAVHPSQVAVIREVYLPTEMEILWAKRIVTTAVSMNEKGEGAFQIDGQMIDEPIIARAREMIELHSSRA